MTERDLIPGYFYEDGSGPAYEIEIDDKRVWIRTSEDQWIALDIERFDDFCTRIDIAKRFVALRQREKEARKPVAPSETQE